MNQMNPTNYFARSAGSFLSVRNLGRALFPASKVALFVGVPVSVVGAAIGSGVTMELGAYVASAGIGYWYGYTDGTRQFIPLPSGRRIEGSASGRDGLETVLRDYRKDANVLSSRRRHSLAILTTASIIYAISLLSHDAGVAKASAEFALPMLAHYLGVKAAEARFAPVSDLERKLS